MTRSISQARDGVEPNKLPPVRREKVLATPRKRLTPQEKSAILNRQDDLCAGCSNSLVWTVIDGAKIYGPMIDEHILPLELGGSNDLANRELRCVPCAKAKTKTDVKRIAKMRRQAKMEEPKPPSRIRNRGFDKSLRRKVNGKVERRHD